MGKRKSSKPPPKPKKSKVPTVFDCPFCQIKDAVEVKINKEANKAVLLCNNCGVDHQATVTYLSEPIDVYSEWIDACEKANE